jgi:hypothetical protein
VGESIAAASHLAIRRAIVRIVCIGVVAAFDSVVHETVTAFRLTAARRTIVAIVVVAVVAFLVALNHAVTAVRRLALSGDAPPLTLRGVGGH